MAGWVKAVLFLFGGVAAAGGTAYVTGLLDPWLAPKPAIVAPAPEAPTPDASAPQQDEPAVAGNDAEAPDAEADALTPEVAADETVTTPKQDRLAPPVFDLLRVEPDGSVLVAGKSSPQALVEVLSGEAVLGKTTAEAGGDFVILLDETLAPGDYRMALRATGPDNESVLSAGTAIISIPEAKDGQVLAMVEEPGAPAQLITVPEPATEAPAATDQQVAEASQPEEQAAEAQAGGEEAAPAPETAAETETQGEAATEAAQGAETAPVQEEAAAVPSEDEPAAPAAEPAVAETVAVEAVEIEGATVFVAGRAQAGRTVRVYAGTVLLGDAVASDGGRFLVEAKRHLDVGTHMIRADLLGADGSVVARAAVPFEREPGESIAAVAPAQDAPQTQAEATVPPADGATEAGDAARPEAQGEVAAAPAAGEAADEAATAPALQRVDGAVIIRRGDSLWRISRRVYGHGIRYSTIYLANQDQIHDPNRIWPGQVFSLPSETPEGETADLEAIGEQAVRPEERETTAQ